MSKLPVAKYTAAVVQVIGRCVVRLKKELPPPGLYPGASSNVVSTWSEVTPLPTRADSHTTRLKRWRPLLHCAAGTGASCLAAADPTRAGSQPVCCALRRDM